MPSPPLLPGCGRQTRPGSTPAESGVNPAVVRASC